ncbi:MAG: hypothetical protein RAK17_05935, partial [Caldisphaera sp.]|nr:hypothetical protein [Caldisphaera sp.]
KIAIISYPDRICESISAAAEVSYLDSYGYSEGKVKIFDYDNDTDKLIKNIIQFKPEAIYLAFGGEQKLSDVNTITINILNSLKNFKYGGSLLIHVRTWIATKQFSTILNNKELADYLGLLKEIRLFTADANAKKFSFYNLIITSSNSMQLSKYAETDITEEHANLLKLSIPPS